MPAYLLDLVDEADVTATLERLDIEIEGPFSGEVRAMLQRPFYLQCVASGAVRLPREPHPRDFHRSFFANLREAFTERFGGAFDVEEPLALAAYNALSAGQEAFRRADLLRVFKSSVEASGAPPGADVREIANWLVASHVLVPYADGRVAFVHQSVTEYLAASVLAHRYQTSAEILKEKLSTTRWDQALFLTLSLLPPDRAHAFLEDVIEADFALALNAVKWRAAATRSSRGYLRKCLIEATV